MVDVCLVNHKNSDIPMLLSVIFGCVLCAGGPASVRIYVKLFRKFTETINGRKEFETIPS